MWNTYSYSNILKFWADSLRVLIFSLRADAKNRFIAKASKYTYYA